MPIDSTYSVYDKCAPHTPSPSEPPAIRFRAYFRPFGEALLVGLLIGLGDILHSDSPEWTISPYLLAGVVLGLRHAGRAWPCWPPLGTSLYVVQIAAIACGRKPPYVVASFQAAKGTLWVFFVAGFGLVVGTGVRLVLEALGWFQRKDGPQCGSCRGRQGACLPASPGSGSPRPSALGLLRREYGLLHTLR